MKILITGAAGFIGSALALRLLEQGNTVVGIDNLNDYYDVRLKKTRLERLEPHPGFSFRKLDIVDRKAMAEIFAGERFDAAMHLAAQAGVRYSIENPNFTRSCACPAIPLGSCPLKSSANNSPAAKTFARTCGTRLAIGCFVAARTCYRDSRANRDKHCRWSCLSKSAVNMIRYVSKTRPALQGWDHCASY